MDEELLNQLIQSLLSGEVETRSPRSQTLPPREMLEAAADVTRVAPRARERGPSIRATPDPPFGNVISQIISGIEGATIEGTPLDPREMGEESPIRPIIEGALNRLRGPSGPMPGEGIPGLELASLLGAGAVTPGPGKFKTIQDAITSISSPRGAFSAVAEDAPSIQRMIKFSPTESLRAFQDAAGNALVLGETVGEKAASRALLARSQLEMLTRANAGDENALRWAQLMFGENDPSMLRELATDRILEVLENENVIFNLLGGR